MSTEPSLRAAKQAATHEALYRAAVRLFHANGFDATTVDEVASAAGVSRRTFFRYFESKEAVIFANQPELQKQFLGFVGDDETVSGYEAVKRAASAMADVFGSEREEAIMVQEIIDAHPALTAADVARDLEWEVYVAEVIAAGSEDPAVQRQARLRAGAVVGLFRAIMREWRREEATVEDLREMVVSNFEALSFGDE